MPLIQKFNKLIISKHNKIKMKFSNKINHLIMNVKMQKMILQLKMIKIPLVTNLSEVGNLEFHLVRIQAQRLHNIFKILKHKKLWALKYNNLIIQFNKVLYNYPFLKRY